MAADFIKTSPVDVNAETFNRFKSLHPQHGSWSWFVRKALENYVKLHTLNVDELVELAIRETTIKDS